MADHSDYLTTEAFAALLARMSALADDQAKLFDPATTTPTNLPTGAIRYSSASNKLEIWNGTAWEDLPLALVSPAIDGGTIDGAAGTFSALTLDPANGSLTGFFGLGSNGVNEATDWNNITASGFYYLGQGLTNSPTAAALNWHCIVARGVNANNVVQIAVARSASAVMYVRHRNGGTWSSWAKVWTDAIDGAGSGLDADLLDGQEGSYYAAAADLADYAPVDAGVYGRGLSLLCRTTGVTIGAGGTTAGTNLEHLGINSGTTNTWTAITVGTWKNVTDKSAGSNAATFFQRI